MDLYPKTKDEWWEQLNENWGDVLKMIMSYYPLKKTYRGPNSSDHGILSAPQAACNTIINDIQHKEPIWDSDEAFSLHVEALREAKDSKLDSIMQKTWFGIPESGSSRELPGFHVFCDLCSESYLLYEQTEKEVTHEDY